MSTPTPVDDTIRAGEPAHSALTEQLADHLMAAVLECQRSGGASPRWSRAARLQDPSAATAFDVEADALLDRSARLKSALENACRLNDADEYDDVVRAHFVEVLELELASTPPDVRAMLEALLGLHVEGRAGADGHPARPEPPPAPRSRVRRLARRLRGALAARGVARVIVPLLLLNGIIASAMGVVVVLDLTVGTALPDVGALMRALSVFAVWALTFIPGWLLVRFLDRRAGALWDEYVVHLHRLGVDRPGNLPEPPRSSSYHLLWRQDSGLARLGMRNIYQEKFDAYYGKSVSRVGIDEDRPVKSEALFPVFLCTGVLAVGWTAIFYDLQRTLGSEPLTEPGSASAPTILGFAFMGAYLYFLQTLMRRYFQADLRAGAYVSGYIRIVSALVIAAVLQVSLFPSLPGLAAVAIAFVIGWFPDVGLKWLLRFASRRLRGAVPSVDPAYPLNRLDGLNVWYEARLLEEGIEDLQNLATAKIVDVLLHTRVPVARLVDWVDQAVLLVHLPPEPAYGDQEGVRPKRRAAQAAKLARRHPRAALRKCGIRSGTSLLRALHPERDATKREELLTQLEKDKVPRARVESLYSVLEADPRLAVVINWQEGDADPRVPLGIGPLKPQPGTQSSTPATTPEQTPWPGRCPG